MISIDWKLLLFIWVAVVMVGNCVGEAVELYLIVDEIKSILYVGCWSVNDVIGINEYKFSSSINRPLFIIVIIQVNNLICFLKNCIEFTYNIRSRLHKVKYVYFDHDKHNLNIDQTDLLNHLN